MKTLTMMLIISSLCACSSMGDSSGASGSGMSRSSTQQSSSLDLSNPSDIYVGS